MGSSWSTGFEGLGGGRTASCWALGETSTGPERGAEVSGRRTQSLPVQQSRSRGLMHPLVQETPVDLEYGFR